MMTKTCNFCGCYSGHDDNCPRAKAGRGDDLAHLRAATEPKDDMLKREAPLPKASPVCPVCGLDRPHGHGQAELVSIIRESKNYATTLAVSMHRQHYAEAAPNWQPLPDLVGLLTQIDNMYAGLRNDLEAAEVENKRLVGANLAALLRIKEAADVLYSEAEEYDFPDGLGMGASQQYWDDLANALFPDDSGEVIQADLERAQAAVDGAWKRFNEEINK